MTRARTRLAVLTGALALILTSQGAFALGAGGPAAMRKQGTAYGDHRARLGAFAPRCRLHHTSRGARRVCRVR